MGALRCLIVILLLHTVSAVTVFNDSPGVDPDKEVSGKDEFVESNKDIETVEDAILIEADMLATESNVNQLYGTQANEKRGSIRSSLGRLWTGNPPVVPYEISDEFSGTEADDAIKKAMEEIERLSCITFRERNEDDHDYIVYVNRIGCWSFIGRRGGPQDISLGDRCWIKRIAVHETMHALGFLHEQGRPDRDEHVTVLYDNIIDGRQSQFRKYDEDVVDSLGEDYDYNSVMQFQNKDFSKSINDTIQKKDDPSYRLGQSDNNGGLTTLDAKQLNLLYKCPTVTTEAPELTTQSPEVTTQSPALTTRSPEVTTEAPEVTTTPAEITTTVPTTTSPDTTPAEITTTVPTTTSPDTTPATTPTCFFCGLITRLRIRRRRRSLRRYTGRRRFGTRRRRRRSSYGRRRGSSYDRRRRRSTGERRIWGLGWTKKDTGGDDTQPEPKEKEGTHIDEVLAELEDNNDDQNKEEGNGKIIDLVDGDDDSTKDSSDAAKMIIEDLEYDDNDDDDDDDDDEQSKEGER